jgi:hypothetical protein
MKLIAAFTHPSALRRISGNEPTDRRPILWLHRRSVFAPTRPPASRPINFRSEIDNDALSSGSAIRDSRGRGALTGGDQFPPVRGSVIDHTRTVDIENTPVPRPEAVEPVVTDKFYPAIPRHSWLDRSRNDDVDGR